MYRRAVSLGRLASVTAMLCSPVAAVLGMLVATGRLSAGAALVSLAAAAGLMALVVRPHVQALDSVARWARALAAGEDPLHPQPGGDRALGDIMAAVDRLGRLWRQSSGESAGSARWNETLLDNLPVPLLLLEPGRGVLRANPAMRRVFGRDVAGRDLAAVLRDPAVLDATEAVLAGGPGREAEFTLPVPVESVFLARIEPLGPPGPDGRASAILTLHDLTTVKRIEQMRADFVANASHELRTPLAALLGFIETLRGPARDDEEARDRFLAIMHEQAARMSRLIADLLSLSRIELNEHTPPSERVDLKQVLSVAAAALHPLAEARGMVLRLTLPDGSADVVGQPDELAQVVQNLLDNAVKYGRDGTAVEVVLARATTLPPAAGSALRSAGALVLAVRDHGEGIPREHLPRLTERFYRVDSARSRKLGGTGLGLAIVKHIVNRHRGALTIESQPGAGSTFSVYLPVADGGG